MHCGPVLEVLVPVKLAFEEVSGGMGSGHGSKVLVNLVPLFSAEIRTHVATSHGWVAVRPVYGLRVRARDNQHGRPRAARSAGAARPPPARCASRGRTRLRWPSQDLRR